MVNRFEWPAEAPRDLSPIVFQGLASGSPALGTPTAPITIVEFSDFECPFCKALATTLSQQVLPAEGSNVRLVFKYFPLRFHPWAEQAAEIGECVHKQDEKAFWQLHDFFFEHQESLSNDTLEQQTLDFLGNNHRINLDQVKVCVETHETKPAVMSDIAQGEQNGVHGTPTLFINGIRVHGAQSATVIRKAIEQASAEQKATNDDRVWEPATPWLGIDAREPYCELFATEGRNPCLLF